MENIITLIISTIAQTIMASYFVINMAQLFTNKKYSKKEIIITIFLTLLIIICSQISKNTLVTLNVFISIFLLGFLLKFYLRVKLFKSFLIAILMSVLVAITELITMSISRVIFQVSIEEILNSNFMTTTSLVIQDIMIILLTKTVIITLNKKSKFINNIKKITLKQAIMYIALLVIYIFPQMLLMIINSYEFSNIFLFINTVQFILIVIFLSIYMKKSFEHEKVQMDLYTSELHNKTLVGMVEGITTLKHDYNNIIQSLNGYITTKKYDKLEEHINSVLKECNIVNNLAVIDPEIFNEPAIYGIVGAKYFLADKDNISFYFSIKTNISKIDFSMPDLSRILGILLDNAIESTKKVQKPYIMLEMKFDKRKNADVIRVINTYDTNINIDLEKIYEKGFSTKNEKSGIGLWEVKKLITKSKNSKVYATIERDKFVQNIIIEKTE